MGCKLAVWFDEIGRESVPLVGGKSANLGEMLRMGIPVPGGFAITTEAYDRFIKETGTDQEISEYLSKFSEGPKGTAEYQEASQVTRHLVEAKEIPQDIGEAIASYYDILCERSGVADVPVAVRSSGVAEDSVSASFAGQYETFLNVRGKAELLKSVKKCWSSLFTTRAITYRTTKGLSSEAEYIGVAVQKMIHARSSGIGFTAHPVTGDHSKIVLEGNWGLGESVVQGIANPDTYVIDKETLSLVERVICKKEKQVVFAERMTVTADIPIEKQQIPCLSDAEAIKLAEFAKTLELHYGIPQDVEWAIESDLPSPGNVFLIQTRPIVSAKRVDPIDQIIEGLLRMKGKYS